MHDYAKPKSTADTQQNAWQIPSPQRSSSSFRFGGETNLHYSGPQPGDLAHYHPELYDARARQRQGELNAKMSTQSESSDGVQWGDVARYFPDSFKNASIQSSSPVQMKAAVAQSADNTPAAIQQTAVTGDSSYSGEQLPESTQSKMEQAFDTDFSGVRIYKNSGMSTAINALAHTQGNDIHFAPGEYQPFTQKGQQLLGHELAHVMQRRQGRVQGKIQTKGMTFNEDTALEKEADKAGVEAASDRSVGLPSSCYNPTTSTREDIIQKKGNFENELASFDPNKMKSKVEANASGEFDEIDNTGKTINHTARAGEVEAIINPSDYGNTTTFGVSNVGKTPVLGWWWIQQTERVQVHHTKTNKISHKVSSWVRFHLLNAHLGGKGNDPKHLVPTTSAANNTHRRWGKFEEGAKEAAKTTPIHYYVSVEYPQEIKNPDPTKPGERYLHFFPQKISAEYSIQGSKEGPPDNKITLTLQDELSQPNLTIGDKKLILSTWPSDKQLRLFGISDQIANDLHKVIDTNKLDHLLKTNQSTISLQTVYDQIVDELTDYWSTKALRPQTLMEFDQEWEKKGGIRDLFLSTSSRMLRLNNNNVQVQGNAQIKTGQNGSMLTLEKIKGMELSDIKKVPGFFRLDDNVLQAIINLAAKSTSVLTRFTEEDLYNEFTKLNTISMLRDVEKNWDAQVKLLTDKLLVTSLTRNVPRNFKLNSEIIEGKGASLRTWEDNNRSLSLAIHILSQLSYIQNLLLTIRAAIDNPMFKVKMNLLYDEERVQVATITKYLDDITPLIQSSVEICNNMEKFTNIINSYFFLIPQDLSAVKGRLKPIENQLQEIETTLGQFLKNPAIANEFNELSKLNLMAVQQMLFGYNSIMEVFYKLIVQRQTPLPSSYKRDASSLNDTNPSGPSGKKPKTSDK